MAATGLELWQQLGFPKVEPEDDRVEDWVVVIDVCPGAGQRDYDLGVLEDLLEAVAECHPSAQYRAGRYALQLHQRAASGPDALRLALGRHDQAAQLVGLTGQSMRRAEVLSLDEFERGCRHHVHPKLERLSDRRPPPVEVYLATRRLVAATTSGEILEILVDFVAQVGGQVHLGPPPHLASIVTVDICVGRRIPMSASADAESVAGYLIWRWLPDLVDDATAGLTRLTSNTGPTTTTGFPG